MSRLTLHRTLLTGLFLTSLAAVPLCQAHDWRYEETRTEARDFVAGGMVHVHLSVGDVHVRRGSDNKIHLRYTVKSRHESNVKEARADLDVRGNDARLELHAPSGGNTAFDVELDVPANTNLDVHGKVGDLTIEDVSGDKDLDLGVGDIRLSGDHEHYRLVHASAGIGDVHGADYGETSGWLGKTLKYRGEGKYELRVHVGVGDIHLEGK